MTFSSGLAVCATITGSGVGAALYLIPRTISTLRWLELHHSPASVPGSVVGQRNADFALVRLPSSGACRGAIERLTCSTTLIVAGLGTLRERDDLRSAACQGLVLGMPRKGGKERTVGLCVQDHGALGQVVGGGSGGSGGSLVPASQAKRVIASAGLDVLRIAPLRKVVTTLGRPRAHSANASINDVNNNLGNLVWEEGARKLVNPYTTDLLHRCSEPDAVLVATANILAATWLSPQQIDLGHHGCNRIGDLLKGSGTAPAVLAGIGVVGKIPDARDGDSDQEIARGYTLLPECRAMLREFASRSGVGGGGGSVPNVGVRGPLSAEICAAHGVKHCVTTGCPSLMLNHAADLGLRLEKAWKVLEREMRSGRRLRICMGLPPEIKSVEFKFMVKEIWLKYDTVIFVQTAADLKNGNELMKGISEGREVVYFFDLAQWRRKLQSCDVFVGGRIHGTMMSVSAGVPAFVLAHDKRLEEMAAAMAIPHIPHRRFRKLTKPSLELLLRNMSFFDGQQFDRQRLKIACSWRKMLASAKLELHPVLEHFSRNCSP